MNSSETIGRQNLVSRMLFPSTATRAWIGMLVAIVIGATLMLLARSILPPVLAVIIIVCIELIGSLAIIYYGLYAILAMREQSKI